MNTRLLMTLSAVLLGMLGISMTFLPQELLTQVGVSPSSSVLRLVQLLGALYLGAAMLNWMNRGALLGGIYGRPVCMANFTNFAVGALALLKGLIAAPASPEVLVVAALYSTFAVWFGIVLFTHPAAVNTDQSRK
jgi:predicted neutral ceramidase superfamily lipid hydrolase